MGRHLLDERTADRLLSGVLAPEDAPPGYADVAALLQAASTPPTPQELTRSSETVAAMAGAVAGTAAVPSAQSRRRAGLSRLLRPRIAATLTAGALALFGGLAGAGALPGPLQHAAHVVLGSIGISVPDSGSPAVTTTPGSPQTIVAPQGGGPSGGGTAETSGGAPTTHHGVAPPAHHIAKGSGEHESTTAAQPHRHHHAGATEGQQALGPHGLCNAWARGRGDDRGKKLSARAFRRLKHMADGNGETVAAFCARTNGGSATSSEGSGGGGSPEGRARPDQGSSDPRKPNSTSA